MLAVSQLKFNSLGLVVLVSVLLLYVGWYSFNVTRSLLSQGSHPAILRATMKTPAIGSVNIGEGNRTLESDITMDQSVSSAICPSDVRRRWLRTSCGALNLTGDPIPWTEIIGRHWIVDDIHKIFYCMIPKAATHTFRYLLATPIIGQLNASVLYPMSSYLQATGFRLLYHLDESERQTVLDTYLKLLVVRHPLDRLRSAWANKMRQPGMLNKQVLYKHRQLIEDYLQAEGRLNTSESFDPLRMALGFDQFLGLIAAHGSDFDDEHWMPFYQTCYPCTIDYDVVMRVETLDDDAPALYPYVTGTSSGSRPTVGSLNADLRVRPAEKLAALSEVYADISSEVLDRILAYYDKDFNLFGYQWNVDNSATCRIWTNSSQAECC